MDSEAGLDHDSSPSLRQSYVTSIKISTSGCHIISLSRSLLVDQCDLLLQLSGTSLALETLCTQGILLVSGLKTKATADLKQSQMFVSSWRRPIMADRQRRNDQSLNK